MDSSSCNRVFLEYILANQTASKITGGSKCQWNSDHHLQLKFNKKAYLFNLILGIIFGFSVILEAFKLALSTDNYVEFKSIGFIVAAGTLLSYHCTWSYLKHKNSYEWMFNNFLKLEKMYWQNGNGNLKNSLESNLKLKVF